MPTYLAFGLVIESELILPELTESDGTPDVLFRSDTIDTRPSDDFAGGYYTLTPELACCWWGELGNFSIEKGRIIRFDLTASADRTVVGTLLIGPMMAMLLHQRGLLVLHGSAVAVEGGVIGFLGDSGQGKSTTATAFVRAGYLLITDDILPVAIDPDADGVTVFPGVQYVKLTPESAGAFGYDPDHLPRILSGKNKRRLQIAQREMEESLPLLRLYMLGDRSERMIESTTLQTGLMALTRHSYSIRDIMTMGDGRRHFLQCAELQRRIPVKWLHRTYGLDELDRMVEEVLKDIRSGDR